MSGSSAVHGRFLIGIDDTDVPESRGTGFHARELGKRLADAGLATVEGITRHQLLVHPDIRYTSHNSAACLAVRAPSDCGPALVAACRDFLKTESAPGADAGLCLAPFASVGPAVQAFGARAKHCVLRRGDTEGPSSGLVIEGLTGDGSGVIGALAAVGLRAGGRDGRFLWLPGLREAAHRRCRVSELAAVTGVERVLAIDGTPVDREDALVDLGPWPRAVLVEGRAVLLVERASDDAADFWRAAPRELVSRY